MNKRFKAEKSEPAPTFEKTINHLESIASTAMNISAITSFDENFDPICMSNIFEAEKIEPEPRF